jgi:hypothetical protein
MLEAGVWRIQNTTKRSGPDADLDVSTAVIRASFGSDDINKYFRAVAAHTKINRLITHAET